GKSPTYPSVRLRMDFRDPNTVGTFIYHCHLLEHEDGGMMGIIRVEPRSQPQTESHMLPDSVGCRSGQHPHIARRVSSANRANVSSPCVKPGPTFQ
ncbi:MAG TPA: multicopper oxidase domain-containing protein, partial [Candidatus Acidoferrales bacterium]|nr:multicopper oxidase domain-containing protein [Candidatus Acidoferrales bacterium]